MLADYHVHTTFCDGKNSAEQMAEEALSLGFSYLGFSSHSYTPFDTSWCMSKEASKEYIEKIKKLKPIYRQKGLELLLGIELDGCSDEDTAQFDYVIGSVHYLPMGSEYVEIDTGKLEKIMSVANKYFDGDFDALAEEYYSFIGSLPERKKFDIVGHIDIIAKHTEKAGITLSERYFNAAYAAIDKLISAKKVFEINTGAIYRSYTSIPYPNERLLKYIKDKGGKIIITGDCHCKESLGKFRELAISLAKSCGFTKQTVITENGFLEIDL